MTPERIRFWKNKKLWMFEEFYFLVHELEPPHQTPFGPYLRTLMVDEFHEWFEWFKASAIFPAQQSDPYAALLPPQMLLKWAESLEDVVIPEIWHSIYAPTSARIETQEHENLSEKGVNNLLTTIGVLALALAESKGPKFGTKDKPNISALVEYCQDAIPDLPPGMASSTFRNRINDGINCLKERQNC